MGKTHSNGVQVATGFKNSNPAPIDDRYLVDTFNDLLDESSIISASLYKWMPVVANDTGLLYAWNGNDRTNADNWEAQSPQIVDITYDELVALRDAGTLIPLTKYKMTDFKTVYKQKKTNIVSDSAQGIADGLDPAVEPLILTATSESTISARAESTVYPKDIIHYDIDRDDTVFGSFDRTGSIVYRKNTTYNIEADFNFMAVKFRRYSLNANAWSPITNYALTGSCRVGDKVYRSLAASNLNNDPATTEGEWWTLVVDETSDTNIKYLSTGQGNLGWVSANTSDYIDCYMICDVSDLANPLPTYLQNFENWKVSGHDANLVLFLSSTYPWSYIHNNEFKMADGDSLTFRPNDSMLGCKFATQGEWSPMSNVIFTSDIINSSCDGGIIEDSLINGLDSVSLLFVNRSMCTAGYGINQWNVWMYNAKDVTIDGTVGESDYGIYADNSYVYLKNCVIKNSATMDLIGGAYMSNVTLDGGYLATYHSKGEFRNSTITGRVNVVSARLENCTIDGDLEWVSADNVRFYNVTIPSNVDLTDCRFSIPEWEGNNTWSGTALSLVSVTIDKRYADSLVSSSVEKFWYKITDINGVDTYHLLE